eukprot:SAG11_NODE_9407_length_915_cov_0.959559_1_plen_84_part_01
MINVHVNRPEMNSSMSNAIKTTKYTIWNFFIKNLWHQFHVKANQYFALVAICFAIPGITNLSPVTGVLALAFVLGVTSWKDAVD